MKNKNLGFIILVALAFLTGCGKENAATPQYSSLLYVNASPVNISLPVSSLYMDGRLYSNGLVGYNLNTGYLGVLPGTHSFEVRQDNGTAFAGAPLQAGITDNFVVNEAYTLISFDSLSTSNTVKLLKLRDTLAPIQDLNSAKVRFWQLAPGYPTTASPNVDVTYLRTSVTPNDSVTIKNRNFPTTSSSAENSFFTTIPVGTYTIKIKAAGTQTVVATVAFTPGKRRIYSQYLTGNGAGRPLAFTQITNF